MIDVYRQADSWRDNEEAGSGHIARASLERASTNLREVLQCPLDHVRQAVQLAKILKAAHWLLQLGEGP